MVTRTRKVRLAASLRVMPKALQSGVDNAQLTLTLAPAATERSQGV